MITDINFIACHCNFPDPNGVYVSSSVLSHCSIKHDDDDDAVYVCQGCVPCHELCKTCTAEGLSYCTTCKYYRQDERCTTECGVDYFIDAADPSTCQRCHSQCVQCRGPTASDCVKCKYYTIYSDLGIGNHDDEEGGDSEPLTVSKSCWHVYHGFQCSPTLNRQPYEGRLPLTSWWRKSSNMAVGQSSLIYLAHHCYD